MRDESVGPGSCLSPQRTNLENKRNQPLYHYYVSIMVAHLVKYECDMSSNAPSNLRSSKTELELFVNVIQIADWVAHYIHGERNCLSVA